MTIQERIERIINKINSIQEEKEEIAESLGIITGEVEVNDKT